MQSQNENVRFSPESSNITRADYNPETSVLTITFKNGGVYHYHNVPTDVWLSYKGSESVGKFFYTYIKDKFDFTRG